MKKIYLLTAVSLAMCTSMSFVSCNDDDDDFGKELGLSEITIENVTTVKDFVQSGTFRMTEGMAAPVILPGQSVSITFNAAKGQALMFATMYGYSNDVFFAPENPGIKLYNDNGTAITGDVSSSVKLWDNGTRVNQAPGAEITHPGTAENQMVTMIDGTDRQGNVYPAASDMMKLTLDYTELTSEFTLTIQNTSGDTDNSTPFSPGVWVVSNYLGTGLVNNAPFFTAGQKSSAALTTLAETGNNEPLADWAEDNTGIITGLSPVVMVIYSGDVNPLFEIDKKESGNGLKELAQKGDATKLKSSVEALSYVKEVFVIGTAPIAPGGKVSTTFTRYEGYRIAYATMFGYSNDWFFGNKEAISATAKGNITDKTQLYDSGTGIDQYPGAGNAQSLFGGTPVVDSRNITVVGEGYPVPDVDDMINISIQ